MEDFNSEFDTLFIPIKGKIYTSENFPHILYDQTVLNIKDRVPKDIKCGSTMEQYTYLSGSIRARRIDEKVTEFLNNNENGIVVELSCRLSTACYRIQTNNKWYCIDSARNIKIREQLFEKRENVTNIKSDIYNYTWLNQIMKDNPNCPILIICVGVFNYYQKATVDKFLHHIFKTKNIEIIFDAVNHIGMKRMKKFYKQMGIKDYKTLFSINDISELKLENTNCTLLDYQVFFDNINKKRIGLLTRIYMKIADVFKMIQIYHISTRNM